MGQEIMSLVFKSGGLSDKGLIRENNEDAWGEIIEHNFFTLADGMGGHQAGEVAAREAVSHLLRLVRKVFKSARKRTLADFAALLKKAIEQVNVIVYKLGHSHSEWRGMGTTLSAVLFQEGGVVIAHVGDSRIYRVRKGVLEQMTRDHSLFSELVELGQLSEHTSSEFAYKNIITKAIGTELALEPEVTVEDLQAGDTYLLCTDGLSDLISLNELNAVLSLNIDAETMVKQLIALAKEKGGHDNVTAIVVKADEK